MPVKKFNCLLLVLLIPGLSISVCYGQSGDERIEELFDILPEAVSEDALEESEIIPALDIIEYYRQHPIVLTETTADVLSELPLFDYVSSLEIIDLVQLSGKRDYDFLEDSLQLSENQIYILSECSIMERNYDEERPNRGKVAVRIRNKRLFEDVKGFRDDKFQGSPLDLYHRTTYSNSFFTVGLLTGKDAGEKSLSDFYSGYMDFNLKNTRVILGDYYPSVGTGNILWRSFGFRKGIEVISPAVQLGSGIKPYRSSIEANFFRGGTLAHKINLGSGHLRSTFWLSKQKRSANIDTSGNIAMSLDNSGFHRTENEIDKKDRLNENIYGGNLEYFSETFAIGITGLYLSYDKIIKSSAKTAFRGKNGIIGSFYGSANFPWARMISEISRDGNGNPGFRTGLQRKTDEYDIALGYRNFSKDFRSPFGHNFGESSAPANETGFYAGFRWKGTNRLRINTYVDYYKTHTATYYVPVPVNGIDLFSEADYNFGSGTRVICRLRYEDKLDSYTDYNLNKKIVFPGNRHSIRFEVKHRINERMKTRMRFEGANVSFDGKKPKESGMAGFVDFSIMLNKFMDFNCRISFFSTDSYSFAIWQYEYAMPGYMTVKPLYGEGMRSIISYKFNIFKKLNLRIRYAFERKNNRDSMGSGLNELNKNYSKMLLLQLDFVY